MLPEEHDRVRFQSLNRVQSLFNFACLPLVKWLIKFQSLNRVQSLFNFPIASAGLLVVLFQSLNRVQSLFNRARVHDLGGSFTDVSIAQSRPIPLQHQYVPASELHSRLVSIAQSRPIPLQPFLCYACVQVLQSFNRSIASNPSSTRDNVLGSRL